MKNKIILHIPHSSLKLTKEFKSVKKQISDIEIVKFNHIITDLFTNQLFTCHKFKSIISKYSRICFDVEKFVDDEQEEMSRYGMGVIYTKTNTKQNMLKYNAEYKNLILKKYYFPYHSKLDRVVNKYLDKNKKVILIDCHSFSKNIIMNNKTQNLPEICIGYNECLGNDLTLLNATNRYFQNLGYKTSINYPYSGSIIPNKLIKHPNKNFSSIMIEINKDLYLDGFKKSKNFSKLKKDLLNYLNYIKKYQF